MKILITATSLSRQPDSPALEAVRELADEIVLNPFGRPLTAEELIVHLDGVDAVIAGLDDYSERVIAASPQLKVISRYGVGVNNVDLQAAAAHGVIVTRTPGANSIAVAELAIGLCFALARRIPALNQDVSAGGWPRSEGIELTGKTFGLIGFGAIGRLVADRARGIGMRVAAYDPMVPADAIEATGAAALGLDEIVSSADVLSLHVPLLESTRHMIDADRIATMKPKAILLNTSRGGLIDEAAARTALDEGRLFGVGLDAYESEPPRDSPLVGHPAVIALPHTGAHTTEAVERMSTGAIENLLSELRGTPSPHRVTA